MKLLPIKPALPVLFRVLLPEEPIKFAKCTSLSKSPSLIHKNIFPQKPL